MTTTHASNAPRLGVIGSGLGGLAAAATLAARGYRVSVFEKNPWLGGKAAVLNGEGRGGEKFRFDMGPTILTVPRVLRRVFEEAGRKLEDYVELVNLDPQWRCFFDSPGSSANASRSTFSGGSVLDLRQRVEDMQQTLRAFGNGHGEQLASRYAEFVKYTERLHRISNEFYFWKPIGGLRDMFDFSNSFQASTLADVMSMRMGRSVASTIRKYTPDDRVAQMLDHFTQYVGSNPYNSPAILCGIASMQVNEGVWYPIGGTRAVPEALIKLGQELGVEYHAGVGVHRIVVDQGKVQGLQTDAGEFVPLAGVVSNMDAVRTKHELVEGEHERHGFRGAGDPEPACSGVVLYLGLNKTYEHLAHHDFVFSRDPEEEFDAIYRKGEPAPDPTCYLAATARTEAPGTVAPEGGEALYVLVHTPYLRSHHDWRKDGPLFRGYRQTILDKLNRTAGLEDIEDRIVFEGALTPQDIHDRYNVLNGAIYGLASHGLFMGAFKPSNRSPIAKGLYLAGGAAHPGPGMPMVMMSGWIAADTLDKDALATAAKH
jgi:phytoene desaturase